MTQGREIKLLPCPCCGSPAITGPDAEYENSNGEPAVECSTCNVMSWTAADWNRRAEPAPDPETLEEIVRRETERPYKIRPAEPVRVPNPSTRTKRLRRWQDAMREAIKYSAPKHVRQRAEDVIQEMENAITYAPAGRTVPSDEEIIEAVKAYGRACSTANTTATEISIRLQEIRALLERFSQPAASAEQRPDEHVYFQDWYSKDAPDESEVSNYDMARHAWLAGVRFADLFPAAPVAASAEPLVRTDQSQPCPHCGAGPYYYCAHPFRDAVPVAAQAQPPIAAIKKLLSNWDDLKPGESESVDAVRTWVAQAQPDPDEDAYVIDRLSKILAEIAVIVRGPEPVGHRHGYADLPERVAALKAQLSGNPGELPEPMKYDGIRKDLYVTGWNDCCAYVRCAMAKTEAPPALNQQLTTEREAFEARFTRPPFEWETKRFGDMESWPGNYKSHAMQCAWDGWQERAALAQQPSAQDREDAAQAHKDGFSDGVIPALQVMTGHGDYGATAYCELLRAAGLDEIIQRAVAEGMWEISGLDRTSEAVAARAAKGE